MMHTINDDAIYKKSLILKAKKFNYKATINQEYNIDI